MERKYRVAVVAVVMALAAVAAPGVVAAQSGQPRTLDSFVGVWEGSANTPNGDVALRSVFKVENGKLGGTIESSMGAIPVVSTAIAGDKLVVTIDFQGTPGTLACLLNGDRIDGIWEVGGDTGSFWLTRGGAGKAASGGDAIAGTWAGDVQIAGQAMPFTLVLRQAGETLAGEIRSEAGAVPLASVSWKDGTLQLAFPYTGGEPVTMTAQLLEGKLVGVVDYNKSEATGTFTAVKK
jgi:hypothetical protein